jgi:undecaprenyl phosphate-alpha-L-ara4N flippase subunit ArnE
MVRHRHVYVLRCLPLSIAYALISIVQVLVPLGAWIFLGETISVHRWIGIGFVLCGTLLVPHPKS